MIVWEPLFWNHLKYGQISTNILYYLTKYDLLTKISVSLLTHSTWFCTQVNFGFFVGVRHRTKWLTHTNIGSFSINRPLGSSSSSSSSSSSGWWWGRSRRIGKRDWNYHLHHAGVVVYISGRVLGRNRWLIHKGSDYGDRWDTVITDASYMSGRWVCK